jgi:hypothetical protein
VVIRILAEEIFEEIASDKSGAAGDEYGFWHEVTRFDQDSFVQCKVAKLSNTSHPK